uniref:Uncharacterized protein n=1 Tax=Macrostomum lignano TaxID=282301 RepID=A0A1I8FQ16_9PLAT
MVHKNPTRPRAHNSGLPDEVPVTLRSSIATSTAKKATMMKCVLIACLALASFNLLKMRWTSMSEGCRRTAALPRCDAARLALCPCDSEPLHPDCRLFLASLAAMSSPMPLASNSFESNACNNLVDGTLSARSLERRLIEGSVRGGPAWLIRVV